MFYKMKGMHDKIKFLSLRFILVSAFIISTIMCDLPQFYREDIYKDSIFKVINVASITDCFSHCQRPEDVFNGCHIVGFFPNDLNKNKTKPVKCHLIAKKGERTGEVIQLEVFVSSSFKCLLIRGQSKHEAIKKGS